VNVFAFYSYELYGTKLKAMKEAPIIPILKFKNGAFPFKIQTIKNFIEEQDEIHEGPHSHNYYEMIWLTKGSGKLYVDMQEYAVGNNTIFCVGPNQTHHFKSEGSMEGFVFSFTDSFFRINEYDFDLAAQNAFLQLFAESRTIKITDEEEEDFKVIILKMMKEFESQYTNRVELLKGYFKIFLLCLTRRLNENIQSAEKTREAELVKNFMELLDRHFKEKKMVTEYAAQLSVTPNYLNRVVKRNSGISAGHHIRQRVVLEAKRMGRYSNAGMKEIAYDLGFLDIAHFSRFFKTFGGGNFSEFKKATWVVPIHAGFHRA
jgi:AraC family transcriptional regulator, transcriptional activator of pobA